MISVVMPAYNAGKTIRDAVESVQAQTVTDWELIVIDDGSSDDTPRILQEIACSDTRIRYLQNDSNRGASYTRNRAVSLAKGEWIAFLDGDDLWKPDKLEKQLLMIETHPDLTICYTGSAFIKDDGTPYEYVMEVPKQATFEMLLQKNVVSCSSALIRASVMKTIPMPGDHMSEDYYVWLTVCRSGMTAYGVNEPLLVYRLGAQTKSSNRLKAAAMSYRTYRAVGFSAIAAGYLTFRYAFYSIRKRHNIYRGAQDKIS